MIAAEEGDVRAGADRRRTGRHRARAGEARVDVDDSAPRSRASITHWKPTGWASAMFEPMITMQSEFCEVLLVVGGAAAPEGGAQTGHRRAVSYACLVLDLDDAERA